MRKLKLLGMAGLGAVLMACVTVNVYFPAAAAENAADRFIRDVYGGEGEQAPPAEPPAGEEQSALPGGAGGALVALLEAVLPTARAQAPDINISTPGINRLKAEMRQRHSALQPYYDSGAIGMAANGLLTVRDATAVPIRERNRVKQLVAEENRDRNALYAEVAKANGHPEWEPRIREIFARRWVANAPSGWWYQAAGGEWRRN